MTDRNPDILKQNKKINELTRRVGRVEENMETLRHAIEPDGWISQAFDKVEEHLTEHDRRFDRLEQKMNKNFLEINHNFAELRSSLSHIIEHLTKLSDLPEE